MYKMLATKIKYVVQEDGGGTKEKTCHPSHVPSEEFENTWWCGGKGGNWIKQSHIQIYLHYILRSGNTSSCGQFDHSY